MTAKVLHEVDTILFPREDEDYYTTATRLFQEALDENPHLAGKNRNWHMRVTTVPSQSFAVMKIEVTDTTPVPFKLSSGIVFVLLTVLTLIVSAITGIGW